MPLNLSPAFNGIPGIYVLGPARDGVHWKIGMASSLIDRLKSYAICFPRGFYIRMLVTLPPMEPGSAWMKPNIEQAVAVIERRIHRALDAEEKLFEQQEQEKKDGQRSHVDALDVYRMTEVHEQSEWFHGAFKDIKAVVARALLELGVGHRAKVHLNLASEKYGPAERGKESGRIPEGDTVKGVDASPLLLEHLLDSNEMAGVNAMFQLHQQSLDPKLQGLAIPDGPLEDRAYEVRAIKGKRVAADGTLEYKVAWKGYKREDWSWEPEAELENARQAIADWESHKAELRARAQQRKAARLERKQASQAARTLTRLPTVVTQRGTGYALKVGPIKRLPRQQGTPHRSQACQKGKLHGLPEHPCPHRCRRLRVLGGLVVERERHALRHILCAA